MEDILIVGAARTAIGKFGGSLAKLPAAELGALVIRKVLERAGVAPEQVSEVIMGQVLTAATGQNPARQAAIRAGLPDMIPAMTINKVCGSGLKAAMLGAQSIAHGDADLIVAGGQESMSLSPHALNGSREGFRMGDAKMVDTMIVDGLWDVYNQYHMGVTAENVAKEYAVTREEQDEFAVGRRNTTGAAPKAGRPRSAVQGQGSGAGGHAQPRARSTPAARPRYHAAPPSLRLPGKRRQPPDGQGQQKRKRERRRAGARAPHRSMALPNPRPPAA